MACLSCERSWSSWFAFAGEESSPLLLFRQEPALLLLAPGEANGDGNNDDDGNGDGDEDDEEEVRDLVWLELEDEEDLQKIRHSSVSVND